jgi:hypothetical protein
MSVLQQQWAFGSHAECVEGRTMMTQEKKMVGTGFRAAAGAGLMVVALLAGCKSAQDKAVDQAKTQAAATNTPQQVQYVDGKGETVTTTVQPPAAAGQPEQVATTVTPPPAGAVVTPYAPPPSDLIGPAGGGQAPVQTAANGPATYPNGQPTNAAPVQGQPTAPAAPMNLTVPAGTEIAIRINETINVKHVAAGQRFSGEVAEPIRRDGVEVIPRNARVHGVIDAAHRRGHFKGRSILELRLTSIDLNGSEYALDTHDNVHTKKGKGKRTGAFIGGMTGVGMLIGAGTLLAGTTGNRDIDIPAESIVHFRLADDLVVQN